MTRATIVDTIAMTISLMEPISSKKRIEIALLAGMVAYDALALQKIKHIDLLKLSFAQLIEDLKILDEAIKNK